MEPYSTIGLCTIEKNPERNIPNRKTQHPIKARSRPTTPTTRPTRIPTHPRTNKVDWKTIIALAVGAAGKELVTSAFRFARRSHNSQQSLFTNGEKEEMVAQINRLNVRSRDFDAKIEAMKLSLQNLSEELEDHIARTRPPKTDSQSA